jgi:hypothetical protein
MNANELADEVVSINDAIESEYNRFKELDEAATMLRKQQSEIEALKAKLDGDKFCDSNCVWTDHHPDCPNGKAQEK